MKFESNRALVGGIATVLIFASTAFIFYIFHENVNHGKRVSDVQPFQATNDQSQASTTNDLAINHDRPLTGSWKCTSSINCLSPFVDFTEDDAEGNTLQIHTYANFKGEGDYRVQYFIYQPDNHIYIENYSYGVPRKNHDITSTTTLTYSLSENKLDTTDSDGNKASYQKIAACEVGEALTVDAPRNLPNDPLDKPRIKDPETVRTLGDVTYNYEPIPFTTSFTPKLISYKSKETLDIINAKLHSRAATNLTCAASTKDAQDLLKARISFSPNTNISQKQCTIQKIKGMSDVELSSTLKKYVSFDSDMTPTLAKNDVLSFNIAYSAYCGGPYPDFGINSGLTYDLKTGQEVAYQDLFSSPEASIAAAKYIFRKNIADAKKNPNEDCNAAALEDETYKYVSFYLSDQGITISTEYPHVIAACNMQATSPLSELKQYINPNGVLGRLVK